MNGNFLRLNAKAAAVLLALGFSGSGWAACEDPSPVYTPAGVNPPLGTEETLSADNYWYTLAGGKVTGCPSNVPTLCQIDGGNGECALPGLLPGVNVSIKSTTANGPAQWHAECYDADTLEPVSCAGVPLVDAVVTDNASGGNACLYSFDYDAAAATAGDPGHIRSLYLCSDGFYEPIPVPPPPPAAVTGCYLNGTSGTKTIYGVEIKCPTLDWGEQRTIFVAKDTENCDENTNTCEVPEGFGFANADGVIDFSNICTCVSADFDPTKTECAPTEAYQKVYPELPLCTVGEGALPVTEIQIQNPRCVTVGGDRRCY